MNRTNISFKVHQVLRKLMRPGRVTLHITIYGISPISPIWKIKHDFLDNKTTSIALTAQMLVLLPRGQLGYLNSNLMLRWDGHFNCAFSVFTYLSSIRIFSLFRSIIEFFSSPTSDALSLLPCLPHWCRMWNGINNCINIAAPLFYLHFETSNGPKFNSSPHALVS